MRRHAPVDDPRQIARFQVLARRAALVENVEWLISTGTGMPEALRRLGYASPDSLHTVLARAGRTDLYAALRGPEPEHPVAHKEVRSIGASSDTLLIEQTSPETRHAAALTVVELAQDRDDAALLLDMLGLTS